jgi:ketosteroid isomerase-like protein
MQRTFLVTSVIGLVVLAIGCAPTPTAKPDPQAMVNSANELDKAFVDAFNKGDAAALAHLYWDSPDVVSFPPDVMQARGIAGIKEASGKSFDAMKGAKLELTESHQIPAGDVVIGWGLWKISMTGPDGKPMGMTGRYSDVKAERDGKWVYLIDHASVPLPPPPAAKK